MKSKAQLLKTLLISLLCISPSLKAEDCSRYIYKSINHQEGLLNTVNSIYKAPGKDIWIGTASDLYRYDGYEIVSYLSDTYINRVIADTKGQIWALTRSGIFRYDPAEDKYDQIKEKDHKHPMPWRGAFIEENGVLFGGAGKIWRYDNQSDSLSTFLEFESNHSFHINDINPLPNGNLLCSGRKGTIEIDRQGHICDSSHFKFPDDIPAALTDSNGRVWIAVYNKGLTVYSKEGKRLEHYSVAENELSSDIVLCLAERDGKIWAGTDGGGIAVIDYDNSTIQIHNHIPGVKSSLPGNSIRTLFVDSYDNVWAGSVRDGVISIKKSLMHTISDSFLEGHLGLSNPTVLSLFQRKDSPYIYIGTDGEGVNRLDQRTEEIRQYKTTFGSKVTSIAKFDDNNLLISLYSKGLYTLNEKTGKVTEFRTGNEDLEHQMRNIGRSVKLANESDGNILIFGNSLYRWNKAARKTEHIDINRKYNDDFFTAIPSTNGITYIHDNYNIYSIRTGSGTAELVINTYPGIINSAYSDNDGIIWIATSKGLMNHSTATGQTDGPIKTNLFNSATSVVKDNKGRVWIGSRNRLFAYLSDSGRFAIFGESDGVRPNEFIHKATLLSEEGNVYMGGVQGLLCIHNNYSIAKTERPDINLSRLSIDNVHTHAKNNEAVAIPKNSKMVEIIVSTDENDFLRNKRFRWTVKTSIAQVYESELPVLTLQPVPPGGKCEILVSCMMRSGEWTEPKRVVTLDIPEEWFRTWWFALICLFAIIIVAVGISTIIITHIEDINKLEMKEKEMSAYEDKIRMLVNWGNEMKTPLTLVQAPLKRILEDMPDNGELYPALTRIYRQSKRVRKFLNIMLDLRTLEEGKANLDLKPYNFNDWISDSSKDFIYEGKAQNVKISEILDPQINIVMFDKNKCDMVLSSFLTEAISNSSRNDIILLSTSLTNEKRIRVSVSGQSNFTTDRLPENMFAGNSGKGSKRSSVAMAYAKILIELHGGNTGAFNNDRGGITAWFELPTDRQDGNISLEPRGYINEVFGNPTEKIKLNEGEPTKIDTVKSRLLLVDDSLELMNFIKTALQSSFLAIDTATDSATALELIQESMPDIIVCDVNMPNGDGFELCSQIKASEKYGHIPVILLTDLEEEKSRQYGYKAGADGILGKPFEIETLYELIRNQLRRKADIKKRYVRINSEDKEYGSSEEQFIITINKAINDNITNPALGVDNLCKSIGVSRAVLYKKLKMITGVGANEYISKIRIEKAIFLIENTDMTFTEIADKTGFSTPSYFSTAFKQHTGQTPTQYKNAIKNKNQR